jgi:LytR cell envelope-related transcriptional attenuator
VPAATTEPPRSATTTEPPRAAPLRARSPSATGSAGPPAAPPGGPRAPTAREQEATSGPEGPSLRDRISGRVIAVAAVVVALAAVGAVVVLAGGGSDEKPKQEPANRVVPPQTPQNGPRRTEGPVQRGETTVAVLNGTTVPGLAAQVSDELSRGGFRRGSVTNAADQQRPATTVAHAPGQKRAADEVAKLLKVPSVSPIDSGTQAIAGGDAAVVVTVGNDRTQ